MDKDKTFKASHFENIQELLNTCKMWIRDDDYDAYCRFFDMGAMEELLNELEKYKELYIRTLGHSLNNSIKQNNKHNNDLGALNEGWKIELNKKDKIIDAMAKFIDTELSSEHLTRVLKKEVLPLKTYQEDIKQYFEKEVKDE